MLECDTSIGAAEHRFVALQNGLNSVCEVFYIFFFLHCLFDFFFSHVNSKNLVKICSEFKHISSFTLRSQYVGRIWRAINPNNQ